MSLVISGTKGLSALDTERIAPENLAEGLHRGGGVLLDSVRKGITGLVNEPRWGLEKQGLYGAVKGFGKGVVRLVASPLTGTLQAVSIVAESIENSAQFAEGKPVGRVLRIRKNVDASKVSLHRELNLTSAKSGDLDALHDGENY